MKIPIEYKTAEEALNIIQSGNRVFVQGSSQTPTCLLKALTKHAPRLRDVELVFVTVFGDIHVDRAEYSDSFKINSLFVSGAIRDDVNKGMADYIPVFLSEIPKLFKTVLPIDVALVQVSPPDEHGYCSLGMSVDVARSAVNTAKHVVAVINPHVPRTHGDGLVHSSRFHAFVQSNAPLYEGGYADKSGAVDLQIGANIASLIDDGSTLQMGIGSIPDAVLQLLTSHKNLGVHTEMCSDGIVDLIEKDIVNNKLKKIHPNKTVTAFAVGTSRLYNYVDDNPAFQFLDIDYVNNPQVIARNPKMIAINSAIEIDITGQVCADSIGTFQYSGVGGQMDFMRGAAESDGGKPIIALPSRTLKGVPRIVPTLKLGAGVVTTRAHVHYVVTEYGIAFLFGKNLRQRAKALINIAHPDDRENLEKSCFERFKIF